MNKCETKYFILLMVVLLLSLSGCSKFKQIRPVSAGIENIVPEGFRKVVVYMAVEIDNPASQLLISDIEGNVSRFGTILGKFTVDPVMLKARTLDRYSMRMTVTLAEGMNVLSLMSLANVKALEECAVDVRAKVALKNGISKKLEYEGIPLANFVK